MKHLKMVFNLIVFYFSPIVRLCLLWVCDLCSAYSLQNIFNLPYMYFIVFLILGEYPLTKYIAYFLLGNITIVIKIKLNSNTH